MELSRGEQTVMEMLWEGSCLNEQGEIKAIEMAKLLKEEHGYGKTSCYTFYSRLEKKGAIARREPGYYIQPIVTKDEALEEMREEAMERLFNGPILEVFSTFLKARDVSQEELAEMRKLIDSFDEEK